MLFAPEGPALVPPVESERRTIVNIGFSRFNNDHGDAH
jgi:hypothetical protein